MLIINHPPRDVPKVEYFDNIKQEFITIEARHIDAVYLKLEHSLMSLSKWESKWKKPFLSKQPKTQAEMLDYIRCMTVNQNVNPLAYDSLTIEHMKRIHDYMEDSMTATTFREEEGKRPNRSVTTAEVIYYEMTALNIPFECEKWHLNRLMTLIRVCSIKNAPPKKANKSKAAKRRTELNRKRLASMNTTG